MTKRLDGARLIWLGLLTVVLAHSGVRASPSFPSFRAAISESALDVRLDTLTYSDALARVLDMSPVLKGADLAHQAAVALERQAGRLPNPELDAEVENFGATGSQQTTLTAGVRQVVQLGGDRRARKRLASSATALAQSAKAVSVAEVSSLLRVRFAEAARAQASLETAEVTLTLAEVGLAAISEQVKVGDRSPVDQTRAEIARSDASASVSKARFARNAATESLAALWGGPVDFEAVGTAPPPMPLPTIDYLVEALEGSAHVAGWSSAADRLESAVGLAKAQQIPDLTLSLGYRRFEGTGESAAVAGLSIPIPVFDRNGGSIRAARLNLDRIHSEREAAIAEARAELVGAYSMASAAWVDVVSLRDDVIPRAVNVASLVEEGYSAGKFSLLELLDAQRALATARMRFHAAVRDYHGATAAIYRLTAPATGRRETQ